MPIDSYSLTGVEKGTKGITLVISPVKIGGLSCPELIDSRDPADTGGEISGRAPG